MIRAFQFVLLVMGLSLVALASAIVTVRFAIHGAEVKVPDFRGLPSADALSKAAGLDMEMTIDNRFYSADVPAGRILTQSPAAGTVVRREWHVRATESLGPQRIAIPDLGGESLRDATMRIRRLGLDLGTVARLPFSSAPAETVIAQDPLAGAADVERPGINLIVSESAPPVTASYVMPDFIGQQYVTAAATITRLGLKSMPATESAVPLSPTTTGAPQLPGTVVGQTPEAGYGIDSATPIQLLIAP